MSRLQPGDVLIFKAGDNWVSKSIAWLTDSDVSHAAMMLDGGKMVEMSLSGIYVSNVDEVDGDDAHVLRLCPEKDAAPLVRAAQVYVDCDTRYDIPALVFLTGLIIYRRIRPTLKFVAITDLILRGACVALDRLIQTAVLKNPDKAMVCSQLVYQVYEDCGKEYHIAIDGGLLQGIDNADGGVCLADLADDAPDLDMGVFQNAVIPDDEELARALYLALTEQEEEAGEDYAVANFGALPSWTKQFLEKLEEFLEKSKSNISIDALFITPADLAYKSTNLNRVCKLDIVRKA